MLDEVLLHVRDLWTYAVDSANLEIYSALAIASTVADVSSKLKHAEGGVKVSSMSKLLLYIYGFLILHSEVKHQLTAHTQLCFIQH